MSDKFHYTKISKKWKWVLDVPCAKTWWFYTYKPEQIIGGFQERNGKCYVGKGVRLLSREQYIKECREQAKAERAALALTLGMSPKDSFIQAIYLNWRGFCDYIFH